VHAPVRMSLLADWRRMEPTPGLIDTLFRDKVRAARAMTPQDRVLAGPRMFEIACEIAKAGIRHQHPDADEERVLQLLRQRLAWARRLEDVD
jgi:hypothetical protein